MTKRMTIMLAAVVILFGGIFGYKAFMNHMMKKFMAAGGMPPVTVTAVKAAMDTWQPQLKAVGSLRAERGVDVASEVAGLVKTVHFTSGDEVKCVLQDADGGVWLGTRTGVTYAGNIFAETR